jgi:protocatechuate 3,4-dioxygenase beta subunit
MRLYSRLRHLDIERRALIRALAGIPAAGLLSGRSEAWPYLEPTPECAGDEPTIPIGAGPNFKPDSPERQSLLEPGLDGPGLEVSGLVLSTSCQPIPRALLDFWHADSEGRYDMRGFRLRGHQFADASGRFRLETVVPGVYGLPRHIHVRVQPPGGEVLTTQLFFHGDPSNTANAQFTPRLAMVVSGAGKQRQALFDFVLRT